MSSAPPDQSLGVFETLLVRDGRVQALDAHLARLAGSVGELYGGRELPSGLRGTVLQRSAGLTGEHRLRVDAVPDGEALRLRWQTSPLAVDSDTHSGADTRLVCRPVVVPGGLGRHKWCDRRRLGEPGDGRSVALLVDRDGDALEAAWANVWLREGRRLITPPADGRLLPGVTRAMLLELAPSLGLETREEPISLARAEAAAEIFLTSSLRLAVPARLEDQPEMAGDRAEVQAIRAALSRHPWD